MLGGNAAVICRPGRDGGGARGSDRRPKAQDVRIELGILIKPSVDFVLELGVIADDFVEELEDGAIELGILIKPSVDFVLELGVIADDFVEELEDGALAKCMDASHGALSEQSPRPIPPRGLGRKAGSNIC